MIYDDLMIDLSDALSIQEIRYFHEIHAHLLALLQELLFQLPEVLGGHLGLPPLAVDRGRPRQLLLYHLLLLLLQHLRRDPFALHELEELPRHLSQSLLGKLDGVGLEFAEGHELDDVSLHVLLGGLRVQGLVIRVQLMHAREVLVAHADDDYREGEAGAPDYLVDGLLHVIDDAVGEQEEDEVLLAHLGHPL